MKAKIIIFLITALAPILLVLFCILGMMSGSPDSVLPVTPFATEEEAYGYQYIGTELGVPWDIVMLTDGIHAKENGKVNISEYNPLFTALEFCVLVEKKYEPEVVWEDEVIENPDETVDGAINPDETVDGAIQPGQDAGMGENAEPEQKTEPEEPETEWKYVNSKKYNGKDEILDYIDKNEDTLTYRDVTELITDIYAAAEDKSTESEKYEVVISVASDYEKILRERIGLTERNIKYVLELYEAKYMEELYGYTYHATDVVLPEIIEGEVTGYTLAEVAVSLLNHPYMMGGKSNKKGVPISALDCSGYVDWVYIQCFGKGVSTGSLPGGVTMSGTALMWYACEPVSESELQVGDLGFLYNPEEMRSGAVNHVGIYIGSVDGEAYFAHCGGSHYGTEEHPTGRVGISVRHGSNSYNPVYGTEFEPAMKSCKFNFFRRPQIGVDE